MDKILIPILSLILLPDVDNASQNLIDELVAINEIDQGFIVSSSSNGEGGVYADTNFTTQASSDVLAWKGFGQNRWNVPNLLIENLGDYSLVWYGGEGDYPKLIDRGEGDKYVRIRNGPSARYSTNPGQIDNPITLPLDVIGVFRIYPQVGNEVDGFLKFQNTQTNWQIALSGFVSTNVSGGLFNRVYVRFTADQNGDWELRLNDLAKQTPDASGTGYTISQNEHNIGSNGHPAEEHVYFRAFNFRVGGFSYSALTQMQRVFESLWPLGKPTFPYDDGLGATWDRNENAWTVNEGVFGGGNGIKGDYSYQWYYWNSEDETDNTPGNPRNNRLDFHTLIPGQSSKTLDRDDIASIYTNGAEPGAGHIWVVCIRTPRDSNGNEGEKISTTFIRDNIP
ncbi:MAG: hypothetical protein KTR16_15465 [Acidiferrobacterales bacterium]|nr:hypothetical protein [Acidiferrobacterales bacterium]